MCLCTIAYVSYVSLFSTIFDRGISAPGNGKEVVDLFNVVDKRFMYQLMSTVQLPRSEIFDSNIQMYTSARKDDVSLAKQFRENLTKKHRKYGVIDQGTPKKRFMKRKWTYRQYHIQDNADVEHKYVKMYFRTNQFSELSFCGQHSKPHGARGLSKSYHLCFHPKVSMGICEIRRITCACAAFTEILHKPWIYGIPPDEQECYNPVIKCT